MARISVLMKDEFRGRTAVVTGGARGIGYAIASRLLKSGVRCTLLDIDEESLRRAIPLLEATEATLPVTADVANAEEVAGALRKTEEELGGGGCFGEQRRHCCPLKNIVGVRSGRMKTGDRHKPHRGVSVLLGRSAGDDRPWVWKDCQHCFHCRQGGESQGLALLGGEGGRNWLDQILRQRVGAERGSGERSGSGGDTDKHP